MGDYKPYPAGTEVAILFSGKKGRVLRHESDSGSFYFYYIQTTEEEQVLYVGQDNVTLPEDELFLLVESCKLIMNDIGYRSLAIGKKDGRWTPFLFHDHSEYDPMVKRNSDVKFIYYWSLNQRQNGN